jgi:DNA-binding GntR family transcriptional regulator
VFFVLKDDIIAGRIGPGDVLHEVTLAQRFAVSKSPVRDALSVLRAAGYVQAIPHRGYVVTNVSVRDVNEVFHLRALLEADGAALAALHATPAQVAELDAILAEAMSGPKGAKPSVYVNLNKRFHLTIADAAGNHLLLRLIDELLEQSARVVALSANKRTSPDPTIALEAAEIIAAIRSKDAAAARTAMAQHIENTRRRILTLDAELSHGS